MCEECLRTRSMTRGSGRPSCKSPRIGRGREMVTIRRTQVERSRERVAGRLPGRFDALVALMPPQAIADDVQLENTTEMIDRLMAVAKLTSGQASYMETLVQLVEAFEAVQYAEDMREAGGRRRVCGIEMLTHLLDENEMNASDLARLLGVHASMGSKILKGERSLTVDHLRILTARFKVSPEAFIE